MSRLTFQMELHIVPLVLGRGEGLFANLNDNEVKLELMRTIGSPDVTHLKYRIVK